MLYLPSIEFQGREFRLPSPADDVVKICAFVSDTNQFDVDVRAILVNNPCLLLFALTSYWQANDRVAAGNFEQLSSWMAREFFRSDIESDAFESCEILTIAQEKRLSSWYDDPTSKRLRKLVVAVTELDSNQVQQWLAEVVDEELSIRGLADQAGFNRKGNLPPWTTCDSGLPVRNIWLVCADFQQLQRRFDSKLLAKKLEAMKQLAYGASHEINNPLANVATRAQSLMLEESNPSKRQRLSVIYSQAMRAHEMISDMMLFAQPPDLSFESAELMDLIDRIVVEMRESLNSNEIVVKIRQYPDVPPCDIDVTQLEVAVKALVNNAIHAIGAHGEIRIQIWRRGDSRIAFSISDTGTGIDSAIADKVFDPFFSGREAGRGLGFGLSKVWRIIEMHDGESILDGGCESGARFVFTLPIKQLNRGKHLASRIDNARAA